MNYDNIDNIPITETKAESGPFLAKVVNHLDPTYMGMLEVELLRPIGNSEDNEGQLHQVRMMSPFWGQTSSDYTAVDPNDYNNTQKSYGMWFVPPDPGTTVVVIFINGDVKRGYWIGCVPDEGMNFMVPGIAATEYSVDSTNGKRLPVAEYNKKVTETISDPTKAKKPKHPLAKVLETQGLLEDDIRGITTSSARREVPSAVFGISTPGPIDKQPNAKKGKVGRSEKQANMFVSRLGGSTFVMDDGDDKFLRKTPAGGEKAGPPVYVNVEQGETGGDVSIPHNELVRIRTRTGHQILLHNSEDLIYIGNARGTTWIELTSNGKIDIYAQDSISLHTEVDLNVTAGRDINLTAANNINLNAGKNINQQAGANWNVKVGAAGKILAQTLDQKAAGIKITSTAGLDLKGENTKLTATGSLDIKSGGTSKWTGGGQVSIGGSAVVISGGSIDLNGPAAPAAAEAASAADATSAPKAQRVPDHEPWPLHENLNPTGTTKDKTVAVDPDAEKKKTENPTYFKKYTTTTDTFRKEKPAETQQ